MQSGLLAVAQTCVHINGMSCASCSRMSLVHITSCAMPEKFRRVQMYHACHERTPHAPASYQHNLATLTADWKARLLHTSRDAPGRSFTASHHAACSCSVVSSRPCSVSPRYSVLALTTKPLGACTMAPAELLVPRSLVKLRVIR